MVNRDIILIGSIEPLKFQIKRNYEIIYEWLLEKISNLYLYDGALIFKFLICSYNLHQYGN